MRESSAGLRPANEAGHRFDRLTVFDEYAAEGVVDLRWSLDGSKAYAVTAAGLAYIYEPPLL